ncbi:MAG: type II toxin-antitoxin system RelE/ParE family toxin [Gemmatimonadota bacterium]
MLLTAGAERDLASIYRHLAEAQSERAADRVLERLLEVSGRLSRFPERGSHPRELLALGIREYRQVVMKPYRIIYRVVKEQVIILLIADGRRDMQTLLARRLLGA